MATSIQQELWAASSAMREHHPQSHPRHDMWFTLAGLMEDLAATLGSRTELTVIEDQILRVARAYQAAVDRPDLDGRL